MDKHKKHIDDLKKLLPTLKGISKKEIKIAIAKEETAIKDISGHVNETNSFYQKIKTEAEKIKAEKEKKEAEKKKIEAEKKAILEAE